MTRTRVFLVGLYGSQNLGDEAIRATIEAAAPGLGAEVIRYASRRDVADPRAVRLRGRGFLRYLQTCVTADRVVLGGGGILKDEGIGMPLELLGTAALARAARRPVALLAVGVGPFYTRLGRAVVAATAHLATVRTVRDSESARVLEEQGVRGVEVCADPMFSVPPPDREDGLPRQRSGTRPRALFALRPWFHKDPDGGAARWTVFREAVAEALGQLTRQGWAVHLACLYWPEDHLAARELVDHAGRGEHLSVVDAPMTWPDLVAEAGAAHVVVAMRYHALVAAAVADRPAIALPYEPKVRALAAELGVTTVEVDDPELSTRVLDALGGDLDRLRAPPFAVADLRERAVRGLERALRADDTGR